VEGDQPEENTGRLALGRHFLTHLSLAVSSDASPPQHPLDTRGMPPAFSWREDLALVQRLGQLAGARESSGPEVLDRACGAASPRIRPCQMDVVEAFTYYAIARSCASSAANSGMGRQGSKYGIEEYIDAK